MEKLIPLGMIIIFIGFLLIIIGIISTIPKTKTQAKAHTKWAIGGFIGPIPFGAWSDKKMFYLLLILMFVLAILTFFLFKK